MKKIQVWGILEGLQEVFKLKQNLMLNYELLFILICGMKNACIIQQNSVQYRINNPQKTSKNSGHENKTILTHLCPCFYCSFIFIRECFLIHRRSHKNDIFFC